MSFIFYCFPLFLCIVHLIRLSYLSLQFFGTLHSVDSPHGSDGKSICLQCGRPRFDPSVGQIPCRRKWQPTLVLLPGKSHGRWSMVGYSPQGRKELDRTERLHFTYTSHVTWTPVFIPTSTSHLPITQHSCVPLHGSFLRSLP